MWETGWCPKDIEKPDRGFHLSPPPPHTRHKNKRCCGGGGEMTISEGGGRGHCYCLSWFMGNGITQIPFWFSLRGNRSKVSFTHSVFTFLFFHSPKRETVVCVKVLLFLLPSSAELWLVNFPKPRRKRGERGRRVKDSCSSLQWLAGG